MPKPYPPEVVDRVLSFRDSDLMYKQIGEQVGLSAAAVQRLFQKHGVPSPLGRGCCTGPNVNKRAYHFDINQAAEMYRNGATYQQIAEHFQIDAGKPSEIVRKRLRGIVQSRVGKASLSDNPQWKNGKSHAKDYLNHRYTCYRVAVGFLQTLLPVGWVIHHLDANNQNNRVSNLSLFPSASLHLSHHQQLLRLQIEDSSEEAIHKVLENGGHLLQPLPDRNAAEPDRDLLRLLEMDGQRLGYRQKWKHVLKNCSRQWALQQS